MNLSGPPGWVTLAGRIALGALAAAVVLVVAQRVLGPPSDGAVGGLVVFAVWMAAGAGLAWVFGTVRGWFGGS